MSCISCPLQFRSDIPADDDASTPRPRRQCPITQEEDPMRYGFVGLGNLGAHLAGSLVRAGFDVAVNDLDKSHAAPLIDKGARWAVTPKLLAETVDAVMTCLPTPAASEAVLAGPDGILAGLQRGGTWIEM